MKRGMGFFWSAANIKVQELCVVLVCLLQDDFGANIDDMLHAQILDSITTAPEPAVLVLLTGDGNMNSGKCCFGVCMRVIVCMFVCLYVYCI